MSDHVTPEEIEADRLAAQNEERFECALRNGYDGFEELNAYASMALAYELRAFRAAKCPGDRDALRAAVDAVRKVLP